MQSESYRRKAQHLLLQLGLNPSKRQGQYLLSALELICENPARLELVTKWLYPDVAARCHASAHAVERGLRAACDTIWYYGDYALMTEIVCFDRETRPAPCMMLLYLHHYLLSETTP